MTGPDPAPRERKEVRRALLGVLERGGGPVLLEGGSGMGKSRLLRELADATERGRYAATAVDWEQDCPYAVAAQLLGVAVADLAGDDAFTTARRLAERIGDRPAVLVVDDAHWCDLPSFRALSTLVRHHRGTPVVVVLAATPGGARPELADLVRRAADVSLSLGPLTADEIEELCLDRGRPLPPWSVQRLARHTLGNPRHVLALLDELDGWDTPDLRLPAPREVAVRVGHRVAGLGKEAWALVEAVACFAEPVGLDEVARTAGLDEVLEPLSDAARAGLVVRFGGRSLPVVGPSDPMVRAAVLDLVGPHRAAGIRRRAAEVVADPQRRLTLLAAATPGQDDGLADRLAQLAARKAGDGAWSDAAYALLEASRLTARSEERELLLIRAVDALIGAGAVVEAEALMPAIENLLDTAIRNSVLGYLAILLGRAAQAERALDRAWELRDPEADPDVAAWICARRVLHALCCGDGAALIAWADRATALVGPTTRPRSRRSPSAGSARPPPAGPTRGWGSTGTWPSRSCADRRSSGSPWGGAGSTSSSGTSTRPGRTWRAPSRRRPSAVPRASRCGPRAGSRGPTSSPGTGTWPCARSGTVCGGRRTPASSSSRHCSGGRPRRSTVCAGTRTGPSASCGTRTRAPRATRSWPCPAARPAPPSPRPAPTTPPWSARWNR